MFELQSIISVIAHNPRVDNKIMEIKGNKSALKHIINMRLTAIKLKLFL